MGASGVQISISSTEIIFFLLALFGVILTAFWSMARLMLAQFERRLDERFAALEKISHERHAFLSEGHHGTEEQVSTMRTDLQDCRQRCAREYITRDEFAENIGRLQCRLEKIADGIIADRRRRGT